MKNSSIASENEEAPFSKGVFSLFSQVGTKLLAYLVLSLASIPALAQVCPPSNVVNPYIGGKVFLDYAHDGVFTTNIDQPIAGVTVTAYNSANVAVGTATSIADGTYLIESAQLSTGTSYRIEFSNFPAGHEQSFAGTNNGTSVQFAAANSCNINLALTNPDFYCQAAPKFVTSCFVEGANTGNDDVLISMHYNSTPTANDAGDAVLVAHEAVASAIGTTYGLAYQRHSKTLFASAYMKRYTGFGPNGSGAIYKISNPYDGALSGSLFVDLNTLFGSNVFGTDPHDFTTLTGGGDIIDANSYNQVTRISFGDLDISSDERTLYGINLNDRSLYIIPLGNDPTNPTPPSSSAEVTVVPLADAGNPLPDLPTISNNSELRPFALKYYKGLLYIGLVTNGQEGGALRGLVYTFNPTNSAFQKKLDFSLNYNRGCGFGQNATCYGSANWQPWHNANTRPTPTVNGLGEQGFPQPILSDIEFDAAGNMILGLRDRFGEQEGNNSAEPTSPFTLRRGDAFGDFLKATTDGENSWTIDMANFTDPSTASGTSEPVFGTDNYGPVQGYYHEETGMGGLGVLLRSNGLVATVMDPRTAAFSNGIDWYDLSTTGVTHTKAITVLTGGNFPFGKAYGLGEIEFICDLAPIQIGNRVWKDTNKNGIQDGDEVGVDGVEIELYKGTSATGSPIATATTANGGQWYFSDKNAAGVTWTGTGADTTLIPNTDYTIKVKTALGTGALATCAAFSIKDAPSAGVADVADSDVNPDGTIVYKTGSEGVNDHTLDIGVIEPVGSLGDFVWKDINNNGKQDALEPGVAGVIVQLLQNSNVIATDTTDANGKYGFSNLESGDYQVKILLSSLPDSCLISPLQNAAGVADSLDSDFDSNGLSQIVTITTTGSGINKDNPTIDAGLFSPKGSLGDFVWKDLNNNGKQDALEPGVAGVIVQLLQNSNVIATDTTDANGKYGFSNLSSGAYQVKILLSSLPDSCIISPLQNAAGVPDSLDSDFDSNGLSQTVTITTTGSGISKDNPTIDAGLFSPKGSLGDFVWKDLNNNGKQDALEPSVAGVIVQLLQNSNVIATDTTDANGKYGFSNLSSGAYQVKILLSSLPDSCLISPLQNAAGVADSLDSDFDSNGLSQTVTITTTGSGINKDNPTIDAGLVNPCKQPSWEITTPAACAPQSQTYSVSFFVNNKNGIIKTNYGTLTGSNPYSVTTIPNNFNLVITDSLNAFCVFDTTITAPDCSCPQVLPLTPNASACIGDTLPTLKVSLVGSNTNGATVEWYSSSTGGTALGTGLSFKPAGLITQNDTFYVQVNSSTTPCTNLDRVPVVVAAIDCEVDITLKKFVNKKIAAIGDTLVFTIKVWNQANNNATGVEVLDSLPNTVAFVNGSFVASRGSASFNNNVITWNIGNIAANGDTVTLTYKIKAVSQGLHFNTAQVSKTNEKDKDSTPGNNDENEDDIDRQCFTVPVKLCPGEVVEASVPAKYTNVQWFLNGQPVNAGNTVLFSETGNYTFTASNNNCPTEGCCPIIIQPGDNCCPENICIPFTISKSKSAIK
ncbi:SdrD B-like domain-containing protein [Runella zeae]|uniref:SdrD B-like domain-containing protein n=2 Tax=Runella zeae TaxID=94255 RepID=UPI0004187C96|nr:SdrD B-like domain-containing protein [Runella zeae]